MKKQRVLFIALLSVLFLFVSCTTVREVFTTVPNMRAEAARTEKQKDIGKTEQGTDKPSEDDSLKIQMFKLKKNSMDFSIGSNVVNAVHDGGRSIIIKYPDAGDIVARATWDALKEEENGFWTDADTTFESGKATVIFPKEITKEQFEEFLSHSSEIAKKCYEVLFPPVVTSESNAKAEPEQEKQIVQEEPVLAEPVAAVQNTVQDKVQEKAQEVATSTDVIADVPVTVPVQEQQTESNIVEEKQDKKIVENQETRITKAPIPAEETKQEVKKTKPPMMDKAGIGIIIITIAIAIAASMVVYFAVIRRRKY